MQWPAPTSCKAAPSSSASFSESVANESSFVHVFVHYAAVGLRRSLAGVFLCNVRACSSVVILQFSIFNLQYFSTKGECPCLTKLLQIDKCKLQIDGLRAKPALGQALQSDLHQRTVGMVSPVHLSLVRVGGSDGPVVGAGRILGVGVVFEKPAESAKSGRRALTLAAAGAMLDAAPLLASGDDGPSRRGGWPVCATGREAEAGGSTFTWDVTSNLRPLGILSRQCSVSSCATGGFCQST